MSDLALQSRSLPPAEILARLRNVDGPGSKLDADLVTAPIARSGGIGGFPSSTSAIAFPFQDPSVMMARYLLGT